MITEKIMNLINNIFIRFFIGWEDIDLLINESLWEPVHDFFAFLFYVLPIKTVIAIFGLFLATMAFRIIVSLIKTLWDLLPLL